MGAAPGAVARRERRAGLADPARPRAGALDALLLAITAGVVVLLRPTFAYHVALVDGLLLLAAIAGFHLMATRPNATGGLAPRVWPWLLVFVASSLAAATGVGLQQWVIEDLLRDVAGIVALVTVVALIRSRRAALRAMQATYLLVAVASTLSVLASASGRAKGWFFENPNYTGHFLAGCVLLVLFGDMPRSRPARVFVAALLAVGVYRTGSFGAIALVLAGLAYWLWGLAHAFRPELRIGLRFLLIGLLATVGWIGAHEVTDATFDSTTGIASARLDRSAGYRVDIWTAAFDALRDDPVGVGPGSVRQLRIADGFESHSDPVAFLVENGPLALVAVGAIIAATWRAGQRGGLTRIVLAGLVTAACFRETFNYRHMWILVAMAIVIDEERQSRRAAVAIA